MTLRRIAGLLTALFMMHLSFAAGDVACATHSRHAASHQPHQHQPCEIPTQANCCSALATCSVTFVANSATLSDVQIEPASFPRAVIDAPLSRIVAPDPPPPKA